MRLAEMTDGEIRRELAVTAKDSQRYDDLMSELEERMIFRNSQRTAMGNMFLSRGPCWHAAIDERD